jgi:ABC-2 type transport system ATP-binding protein
LDVLVREQMIETILERVSDCTILIASHDLSEIESFASHVGYLSDGRLEFTEEMGSLSDRFREIEVILDQEASATGEWPVSWLNPEQVSVVVRFVDAHFERDRTEAEIRRRFPGARGVTITNMPLRSIFVALAKSARHSKSGKVS